jgi:hypothetical protein
MRELVENKLTTHSLKVRFARRAIPIGEVVVLASLGYRLKT